MAARCASTSGSEPLMLRSGLLSCLLRANSCATFQDANASRCASRSSSSSHALKFPQLRGSGPFPFKLDGPSPRDEVLLVPGFLTPVMLMTRCLTDIFWRWSLVNFFMASCTVRSCWGPNRFLLGFPFTGDSQRSFLIGDRRLSLAGDPWRLFFAMVVQVITVGLALFRRWGGINTC